MNRIKWIGAVIGMAAFAVGCADPLVGAWQAKEDKSVDLDIQVGNSGYEGDGHIYLCNDTDCYLCPFDFEADEDGNNKWNINGQFTGQCSSAGAFEGVTCKLQSATDLECDVGPGVTIEYEKDE